MYRKGKLYFRYGTMGSAKTALLLTTAYNFEERHMSYLCMKPAIDTREGDRVIHSRIGIERACEWIYPDTDLYRFAKNYFKKEGKLVDWFFGRRGPISERTTSGSAVAHCGRLRMQRNLLRTTHGFPEPPIRGLAPPFRNCRYHRRS